MLLAVVGLTAWSLSQPDGPRDDRFGGIACSEVHANIDAYMEGLLLGELADRIRVHLAECPDCKAAMKKMGMEMGAGSPRRPLIHGPRAQSWTFAQSHGQQSRWPGR